MIIAAVPPNMMDFYWDKISVFLDKLKENRKCSVPKKRLYEDAIKGRVIPMVVSDGKAIITVFMFEIKDNAIYATYMYGSRMAEWLDDVIDAAKKLAKDMKIPYLRVNLEDGETRRGWIRVFKRKDFVLNGNNMEYKL